MERSVEKNIGRDFTLYTRRSFYLQLFLVPISDIAVVIVLTKPVQIIALGSLVLHTNITKNFKNMSDNRRLRTLIFGM